MANLKNIKYSIIRSRRKTLAITVKSDGQVVVRSPLRTSDEQIEKFIREKWHWIEKSIEKASQNLQFKNSFDFIKYVYILGKRYNIEDYPKFEKISKKGDITNNIDEFEGAYRQLANEYLPQKAQQISHLTALKYKQIKICKSKRCWGSFNKDGLMKLNYKLILLPEPLVEYIIVHELCHSKQLNHSQKFWGLVGKILPNYQILKEQLNRYSFLL